MYYLIEIRKFILALAAVAVLIPPSAIAADANGYTAEYECRAGGPRCNVDVAALGSRGCSQVITATTPWSAINWANNTICIEAGDHTAKGTLRIPPTANGSAGNYKVLRYFRDVDSNDDPWRQTPTAQARLSRIVIEGDYWLIHRLSFPAVSGVSERIAYYATANNDVRDIIINRILIEGNGQGYGYYGVATNGDNSQDYQGLSVQNSVMRNVGPVQPGWESIAISLHVGDAIRNSRFYIVNNEIYDWVSHPIQIGRNELPTIPGIVVENNDLYVTPALHTGDGRAKTESALSTKVAGTAAYPVLVLNNRIWGTRPTHLDYCCNGDGGQAVGQYTFNAFTLYRNNIVFDAQVGFDNVPNDNSLVGNLLYKIAPFYPPAASYAWRTWWHPDMGLGNRYETYLNTIIHAIGNSVRFNYGDTDTRCNVVIDSGPAGVDYNVAGGTQADFNVFYGAPKFALNGTDSNVDRALLSRANATPYNVGDVLRTGPIESCGSGGSSACFLYRVTQAGITAATAPAYCTTLGCITTDGSVRVQAIRGPHIFYRRLQTTPEIYAIPYATAHSSAEEATFCPSSFANRPGIGINNDVAWNGIFARDILGITRTGTPGAFEAVAGSTGGSQTPHPGPNPHPIPGTVEAENFDNGGEGVAFHDVDGNNTNNAYRATPVDVQASSGSEAGGYDVGWTRAGEWLEYTVNVASAGTYNVEIRVASDGDGGVFHLEFNGQDVTGPITVPNTGGWQNWQTITRTVNLSAGQQVMRLFEDTSSLATNSIGNINWLRFTATSGGNTTYISDLPYVAVANGYGPVERDTSNGEDLAGDGNPIRLNGVTYSKGLGVHAVSEVRVPLNGNYTRFISDIGIDDEMDGTPGSAQFEVWADGTLLYQSPDMNAASSTITVNVDVTGRQELRLIVNEGSVGCCDHADWAGARLTSGNTPPPTAYVSDLAYVAVSNGYGPVEKDTSNGENLAGDGNPIRLNGVTYAKGLGVHAVSEVRVPLNGAYTRFISDIGIDDEMDGTAGTAQFEVWADGTLLYQSPDMNTTSSTITVDVDVTGRQELRLIVNEGSVGCCDHADWAGARLTTEAGGGGSSPLLTGAIATPPSAVNLTSEGTVDWAHWGLSGAGSFNRRAGITPLISNYTVIGAGAVGSYGDNLVAYSWSNGTPTSTATSTTTGVYADGIGNGFEVTVPADTTTRTVKIYVGAWAGTGRLQATLSDNSAPAYVDTSLTGGSNDGGSVAVYSINYRAGSANQQLTLRWTLHGTSGGGNVQLQGVTLG